MGWAFGIMVACVPYCCTAAAVCFLSLPCCCCCFVVGLCLLARVGVLGHRRGMALGHACGMPPTGANIAVLLLETKLAACSRYTENRAVVSLGVGVMACVPYRRAAVCCLSSSSLLLVYACACWCAPSSKRGMPSTGVNMLCYY